MSWPARWPTGFSVAWASSSCIPPIIPSPSNCSWAPAAPCAGGKANLSGYGASIPAIPSPKASPPISSWKRKRCTANSSTSLSRMSWCSTAGSAAANCSAPAVAGTAGLGKVFYFQPGHETNPTFHNPYVQRVLVNAVRWAEPVNWRNQLDAPCQEKPVEAMHADGETLTEY